MDKSKILELRTTIYKVGDIENAKKWYANIFMTEPYNVGGDLMTATVKDLWGNLIGFIYNPAFKLK